MRILHIDESFHTMYGYHTAPIAKEEAKKGHEVYVITVQADKLYPVFKEFGDETPPDLILKYDRDFENKYRVHIIRVPIWGYVSYRAVYSLKIYREIKRINPDVILCHNSDSLMAIRMLLKRDKYPIVYDSHMLSMASENRLSKYYLKVYRKLITPKIIKKKSIIIRTQDDPYIIKEENVPVSQAPFISFGTDTDLFYYDEELKQKLRSEFNIGNNDFVVVYTGKLNKEKGAELLAEITQFAFDPGFYDNIVFLIVGNTKGEYGERINSMFSKSSNRIIRFPAQKYMELAKFYQVGDLSVFPKQCSMSFYDAQACGLPVLSEDNSVNIDRCSHHNGFNFKADSAEAFINEIQNCLNMPKPQYKEYIENAVKFVSTNFSYTKITEEYDHLLEESISIYKRSNKT